MLIPVAPSGAQTIWVSDYATGDVGTFDRTLGTVTKTSLLGTAMTDIAFNPVNRIFYGIGYNDNLYTFDPTSGATTLIGNDGGVFLAGLGFRNDGLLVGGTGNDLYTINITTGAATHVQSLSGSGQGADLVFDSSNNLYLTTADAHIYKFTDFLGSSAYADLGSTGLPDGGVALAYNGSQLYVFDNGTSQFSVFNPISSAHTVFSYSGNLGSIVGGATFEPAISGVPEPGALAILPGLGVASLFTVRRIRRRAQPNEQLG